MAEKVRLLDFAVLSWELAQILSSIRVPSFCNGIYGFKPTANRVPYGGQKSPGRLGSPGIPAVAGPHAHSAADLTFFTKQVFLAKPWTRDSTAVGSPWLEIPGNPVLDIGVIISDANFPVNPSVTRTMHSAIEKLNLAGHNVKVLSNFPRIMEGTKIASKFFMLDNNKPRCNISKRAAKSALRH